MYMNLKPNNHKRISFNTTTMASLGFIDLALKSSSVPQKLIFYSGPLQFFWSEILRSSPKIRGWCCYHGYTILFQNIDTSTSCNGKNLNYQNLNLISSGWNTKFFMQRKSTQYLPLPQF